MITQFISKILGDPNEKYLNTCQKTVEKIRKQVGEYKNLLKTDIPKKTEEFKQRLQNGETHKDILVEAFALHVRACELINGESFELRGQNLVWNMIPYDVQLIGGIILNEGKIAEMKTGEGKTLVATLPLYLRALSGKGAFLVTVNEYLAQRDAEWMGVLFNTLGLSVGVIHHGQSHEEKQAAYNCDITYGTNNEFGFDYLRDNMAIRLEQCVQRDLYYAIVDEVDSILIDEARTPLIISAPAEASNERYKKYAQLVKRLEKDTHYTVDEKGRAALLSDEGIGKMEELLGIENIYTEAGAVEVHHIEQALKAEALFTKNVDYLVNEDEVVIIDEFTGRAMKGRRYSEGLHQAIEAKENVKIKRESKTLATITFQNFFRLFNTVAGMTGTAITEAEEFSKIYELETIVVPTKKPIARLDRNDLVYKSFLGKMTAVTKKVKSLQEKGQPVLVGTISVEKSEILSDAFKKAGISHAVLNAKQHEKEADIVAKAGEKGAVTIATNMAGRGTDIKVSQEVLDLGGLFIIGTERHDSRRIDNQLRGRSGRQGDVGESQFYVSMDDELMRLFGGDRMKSLMNTLQVPEDMPIENGIISRSIESAQRRVEGYNFDVRKHLVEYDDVMNKHRTIIYKRRNSVLRKENVHESLLEMIKSVSSSIIRRNTQGQPSINWDIEILSEELHQLSGFLKSEISRKVSTFENEEDLIEYSQYLFTDRLLDKKENFNNEPVFLQLERQVYLQTIDRLWMDHIDSMVKLREQVTFSGYAQKDPLIEYKKHGFEKFENLLASISLNTVQTLLRMDYNRFKEPITPKKEELKTNTEEVSDISEGDRELIKQAPLSENNEKPEKT